VRAISTKSLTCSTAAYREWLPPNGPLHNNFQMGQANKEELHKMHEIILRLMQSALTLATKSFVGFVLKANLDTFCLKNSSTTIPKSSTMSRRDIYIIIWRYTIC
jgi:hypothetical protein